jgi:uncharacterized protein YjaZ
MKTFIGSLIILLAIIIGIIASTSYIENFSDSICTKIKKIQDLSAENNFLEAEEVFKNLKKEWDKKEKVLRALVEHQLVENIHIDLIELSLDIKNKNIKNITAECSKLLFKVNHLFEKETFTMPNLF